MRRIQILSHHFKIATRIDVFIGSAGGKSILDDEHDSNSDLNADTSKISFMKLGYVELIFFGFLVRLQVILKR